MAQEKMHTVWVRLNAVVFFGLTVIVCLAVITWFSTITHRGYPTVTALKLNTLKSLRSHVGIPNGSSTLPLAPSLIAALILATTGEPRHRGPDLRP